MMRAVATEADAWRVHPHDPMQQLAPNLWRVEGSLPGMTIRRVMTIARRRDGLLVVHNGIALDDAEMKRVEALGELAWLVVPNGYHRLDAPAFKKRYPDIRVTCPAGARKRVEKVVPVDVDYDGHPPDPDVTVRHVAGTKQAEGAMIVQHEGAATVVLNDLVFNMPHGSGFTGWVFKHVTQSSGGPRMSRIAKLFLVSDRRAAADDLRALAATPGLQRVIVSHHEVIDRDAAAVLRGVADALAPA